ncbi:MAG: hypothetical protein JWN38_259 [Candidatus Saccharibacteria bacterium]|nr:hypothetical protein [Candidatus Saccharibacteria bacterium]
MRKQPFTQFNCFSPPVMLATLIIEFSLAAYSLWRYKMNTIARLVVASLVALGLFQLCEYQVCTGFGVPAEQWSRLGYVAITALPPLGLHMLYVLAGKPGRKVIAAAYTTMAGCMVYFTIYSAAFIGHKCAGNYVIFQIGAKPAIAYGIYYYGWLLTGIVLGVRWINQLTDSDRQTTTRQATVRALIIGYLVFLVPTAVANTIKPETRKGIPSIMCGFAVLFAIILATYILPRAGKLLTKRPAA